MSHRGRSLLAGLVSCLVLIVAIAWQASGPSPAAAVSPKFWKGNLHTHSLWSDGDDFPDMIADWYKKKGYDFLALTEHNVIAVGDKWVDADTNANRKKAVSKYLDRFGPEWVEKRTEAGKTQYRLKPLADVKAKLEEPGKFLMVPAEEISARYAKFPIHINAINLQEAIKPIEGKDATETIDLNLRAVAEQRSRAKQRLIAFLNHPNFGWAVKAEDMVMTDALRFFEVFNGHPGVRNYGDATHSSTERIWDIVLALRLGKFNLPVIYGLGTDDAHRYHDADQKQSTPGRGWVMVRAEKLDAETLLKAMEEGDFYATSGVILDDVREEGNELSLAIKAEPGVTYRTQFIATMKGAPFDSRPVVGADGKELPGVTRLYSEEIGRVLAEATGTNPRYKFTGNELYVRAKVVSSKPHPNPFQVGNTETAWTQPMRP